MLTWVEIDSRALIHNLRQFKKLVGKDVLLMPVVKGNAYGHGMVEVAKICAGSGLADRLCIASLNEALELRKAGITTPLVVISFYELVLADLIKAIQDNVALVVYERGQLSALRRAAKRAGRPATIHLKVDVGTSRVGFLPREALQIADFIAKDSSFILEGVWSHFASSESDMAETKRQQTVFESLISDLEKQGISVPIKHISCTAATIVLAPSRFNAVRVGIGLYGLHPSEKCRPVVALKPALAWRTTVIQIKNVPAGTKISYGGAYVTKRNTRLGILPVGYYDGYDRSLSSRAYVVVRGRRCPVLGRVCMNLTMVDLTDAPGSVKVGEHVWLTGGNKKSAITADELAECAGTINYEIVDRINPLLPRIYR